MSFPKTKNIIGILILGFMLFVNMFQVPVLAEEDPIDCKTLTEEKCTPNISCEWILGEDQESGVCNEIAPVTPTPSEPAKNLPKLPESVLKLQMQERLETENWQPSKLQTFGLKFLVRGKEALAWTLSAKDEAFENSTIETSYRKVLTVVNSLFILGLLAIAAMWMFSLFIPRQYLKQVMLYYVAAVIFVNFALPLTKLLVDGTSLLQNTLLTNGEDRIAITDIIELPTSYNDVIGYQKNESELTTTEERKLSLKLGESEDVTIGNIKNEDDLQYTGAITPSGEAPQAVDIVASRGNQSVIQLSPVIEGSLSAETTFNPNQESEYFQFVMILLTGLGYFLLALIFVLRIVILWLLVIVSPALFLLAVFQSTRGWFINWLSVYGRWLLVGPLIAIGLATVVGIWKTVGVPISSTYTSATEFVSGGNINFYLPGSEMANTLSSAQEMMEYIIFLIMLYLPIALGFMLTRHKTWAGVLNFVSFPIREKSKTNSKEISKENESKETVKETKSQSILGNITDFMGMQAGKISQTIIPENLRRIGRSEEKMPTFSASSFLPESLALTSLNGLMGLLGAQSGSRHSKEEVIEKLANSENIPNEMDRKHAEAVRDEIEKRVQASDPEAMILMNEIHEKESEMEKESSLPEAPLSQSGGTTVYETKNETTVNQTTESTTQNISQEEGKDKEKGKDESGHHQAKTSEKGTEQNEELKEEEQIEDQIEEHNQQDISKTQDNEQ